MTKLLHRLRDQPVQARELLLKTAEAAGYDLLDLRVVVGGGDDLARARAEADGLHAAMPTDWAALEALAAQKGYASTTAIARAVREEVGAIRTYRRSNYVPAPTMQEMALAPQAAPPRRYAPGSVPDNIARHDTPALREMFSREALRRIGEGSNRVSPRAVVEALRERGEYRGNDHVADRLALRFVVDHPEHAEKFR